MSFVKLSIICSVSAEKPSVAMAANTMSISFIALVLDSACKDTTFSENAKKNLHFPQEYSKNNKSDACHTSRHHITLNA